MKTYDVHFNDNNETNYKGFNMTINEAMDYIANNNGTNNSYFADYKGSEVSIVCNEDGEIVYTETIR